MTIWVMIVVFAYDGSAIAHSAYSDEQPCLTKAADYRVNSRSTVRVTCERVYAPEVKR